MALNLQYGDNFISSIKKGEITYKIQDAELLAGVQSIQASLDELTANGEGSVKSQVDAGVQSANGYTDGAIGGVQTQLATAVAGAQANAISVAAEDATTKADGAQSNAISAAALDATTKANGAQANAISAAALDATTKADGAQANAISVAAEDATTKANAAQAGAQSYAKALIDKVLGSDSAADTIVGVQNILAELKDPSNNGGLAETFIDTVKTDLAGLNGTVAQHVASEITTGIQALDATVDSTGGANVGFQVVEADGVITGVTVTTDNTVSTTTFNSTIGTIPGQQSVKDYVDNKVSASISGQQSSWVDENHVLNLTL